MNPKKDRTQDRANSECWEVNPKEFLDGDTLLREKISVAARDALKNFFKQYENPDTQHYGKDMESEQTEEQKRLEMELEKYRYDIDRMVRSSIKFGMSQEKAEKSLRPKLEKIKAAKGK